MKQQDLVETRVWIKENTGEKRTNRIAIHPADIHYYEEYKEDDLVDVRGEKVLVRLYSAEPVIILQDFDVFFKKMQSYREMTHNENIMKGRN